MNSLTNWLLALLAVTWLSACSGAKTADGNEAAMHRYLQAFNAQDATAMGQMVTEDVKWLSISGDSVSIEVEGRSALMTAMEDYFKSCPSCRSKTDGLVSTGDRVSVVEVASWESSSGRKSQRSLAVYQFSGPLIQSVYYFPEEP